MKQASFCFCFDTNEDACLIADALSPECLQKIPKTNISVSTKNNCFLLHIQSSDTSSLRAACNSYLRWVQTILGVNEVV